MILGIAEGLDENADRIELLRLTHEVYPIYRLNSPSRPDLRSVMDAYSGWVVTDARGTAYGLGLKYLLERCIELQRKGFDTTGLVFGDGKNEPVPGGGGNWRSSSARQWPGGRANRHRLGFVFLEPGSDRVFQPLLDRFPANHCAVLNPVQASRRTALKQLEDLIRS
ncbi:MAG: hypothetical protein VKO64_09395 [Candidatus Sericytochromatia bacterium]|nr:hypothetical protein [Candidatus Sericytochromatia bacterium]